MLSETMKFSPQGRGFPVRCSLGPVGPVSEGHGVFTNRGLLSMSGVQPRTTAVRDFILTQVRTSHFVCLTAL